jgi:hypothetical protein
VSQPDRDTAELGASSGGDHHSGPAPRRHDGAHQRAGFEFGQHGALRHSGHAVAPEPHERLLEAVYYDTPDLRLLFEGQAMTGSSGAERPVVVGVDASDSAHHAALWAVDLAAARGCGVDLVHVVRAVRIVPDWLTEIANSADRAGALPCRVDVVTAACSTCCSPARTQQT